jgi:CRP-like cAMP-binding protein
MQRSRIWLFKHRHAAPRPSEEGWRQLTAQGREWLCVKGQILCGGDDPGGSAFLVRTGRVRVCCFDARGREIVAGILEPGDLLGQLPRIDAPLLEGYAEALTNVQVLRMNEQTLLKVWERENPALQEQLEQARRRGAWRD